MVRTSAPTVSCAGGSVGVWYTTAGIGAGFEGGSGGGTTVAVDGGGGGGSDGSDGGEGSVCTIGTPSL